jgi:pentatricopeptide repeat protein
VLAKARPQTPKTLSLQSRSKFLEGLQLAPDVVTYTTLLRGVARPGALASVLRLAEEMHAAPSCTFDRVAYGALIDACVACGSPDTAESVLAEMEERGKEDPKLRPGPHAFLALMRAFAAVGEMERCEEMREGMFSSRCGGWASVGERQEADELCMEAAIASGYVSGGLGVWAFRV